MCGNCKILRHFLLFPLLLSEPPANETERKQTFINTIRREKLLLQCNFINVIHALLLVIGKYILLFQLVFFVRFGPASRRRSQHRSMHELQRESPESRMRRILYRPSANVCVCARRISHMRACSAATQRIAFIRHFIEAADLYTHIQLLFVYIRMNERRCYPHYSLH